MGGTARANAFLMTILSAFLCFYVLVISYLRVVFPSFRFLSLFLALSFSLPLPILLSLSLHSFSCRLALPWEDLASLVHEASLEFLTSLCDREALDKRAQEHEEVERKTKKKKKREEHHEEDKVQKGEKKSEEEEEEEKTKEKLMKKDTSQSKMDREEKEAKQEIPFSSRREVGKATEYLPVSLLRSMRYFS